MRDPARAETFRPLLTDFSHKLMVAATIAAYQEIAAPEVLAQVSDKVLHDFAPN